MRSTLGEFVLWLHTTASADGRILAQDPDADAILAALQSGKGNPIGVELYRGKPNSKEARLILRRATSRLYSLPVVLRYIEDKGYTTIAIRALLSHHWQRLGTATVGTIENAVWLDLQTALAKVPRESRYVAGMLVAGNGPKQVAEKFGATGSRKISKACIDLVRVLEPVEATNAPNIQ